MKVHLRRLDSIRPYERNPRLNDQAVSAVAKSIETFGFRQPIVVDGDGVIIVGHCRFKAAKQLGLEKVPVHVATDLTPEQAKAYRLADNRTNELSEWDYELLPFELQDLQACNFDLGLLGFSADELASLLEPGTSGLIDPDSIPAPPDEPTSKRGDLWILGSHRLLCGDSSKPAYLDRLLDGEPIHLVNMDPPYNVNVESRSKNAIAAGTGSPGRGHHQQFDASRSSGPTKGTTEKLRAKDRPLENDFLPPEEFERLLVAWFQNAARVLIPGGGFYIWGGYANFANYPKPLADAGLYLSQAIVWIKEHPVLTRKDFLGNHEWAFYGWKSGAAHRFFGSDSIRDTWELSRANAGNVAIGRGVQLVTPEGSKIEVSLPKPESKARLVQVGNEPVILHGSTEGTDVWRVKKVTPQAMVHLTEKPVELATRAIEYSSQAGENVLDLFGGSGSTLIGCEMTGRRAHLIELDPAYCDVIVERWEKFTGRKAERREAIIA
jgi:DNA modification methylase